MYLIWSFFVMIEVPEAPSNKIAPHKHPACNQISLIQQAVLSNLQTRHLRMDLDRLLCKEKNKQHMSVLHNICI